jgi:hypothetical protein
MAAMMDDNEVAARRQGQREYECNKQIIVVDCARGKQMLNNTISGDNGRHEASGQRTT